MIVLRRASHPYVQGVARVHQSEGGESPKDQIERSKNFSGRVKRRRQRGWARLIRALHFRYLSLPRWSTTTRFVSFLIFYSVFSFLRLIAIRGRFGGMKLIVTIARRKFVILFYFYSPLLRELILKLEEKWILMLFIPIYFSKIFEKCIRGKITK